MNGKIVSLICFTVILTLVISGCRRETRPLVAPYNSSLAVQPTPTAETVATAAVPINETPTDLQTPTPIADPSPTAQPTLTPAPDRWTIQIRANVPQEIRAAAEQLDSFEVISQGSADLIIDFDQGQPLVSWVFAAVGPFATLREQVSSEQLLQAPLISDPESAAMWQTAFPNITAVPAEEFDTTLWENREQLAIVPFHRLGLNMKALPVDGQSALTRGLDLSGYPLVKRIGISGDPQAVDILTESWPLTSNRDENRLTRVTMTGVTALVRATAAQMEYSGILFPGEEVAPILQTADIAHISNEVPFAEECPYPNATSQSLVFCSRDSYFELLTHLGADVIEVTGNHSNDYGPESMVRSLDLYEAAGMQYYGGGRNLADGQQAAIFLDHGNQIAFVGCNPVGPAFAWATAERAGATPCNDYAQIEAQISDLAAEGAVVIATMQYQEIYDYFPTASQKRDFGRLAEAGAAAVSGSQSHHPQGFAIQNGSFIHYGLGNLFFDQMDRISTRQMFMDTYVIYDGRLLNVELWTGLIEFYARPRPMTAAERNDLLRTVFAASGW